jgi:hypothetical protein
MNALTTQQRRCAAAAPRKAQQFRPHIAVNAYTVTRIDGGSSESSAREVDVPRLLIGSSSTADVLLDAAQGVEPEHAELLLKGRQVFCRALLGESVFDR